LARPVGRPSLPYETRHVMLNIRTEYYVKLKNQGENMSKIVNDFLHARHEYTICPLCYSVEVTQVHCNRCLGRALVCGNPSCKKHHRVQKRECKIDPETGAQCTEQEFKGT